MPSKIDVDRNLLFAVIALQDDLIDQAQFADVCAGWAVRLERPLADLLLERGWITREDRSELERKLERKLKKYHGDIRATLGAVAEIEARDVLQEIGNPEVRQSINRLMPARGHVLVETLVPPSTRRDSLRYTLTRLHAEGGLGKVWIAHDTDLNRDVALKEIKATSAASPESWRRFLQEAQITGQLEHPNIVPVYELARRKEDDQPFYTMRFVRGQSLRDAIADFHRRRGGKPIERLELQRQLLEPFIKVCQAIGYAHARGVIHRDLKPENIVLGGHGEVVVLDWGLAKVLGQPDEDTKSLEPGIAVSAEAQAARTEGQLGTPAYMAPEQVEARNDLIGTQTDVYGLGTILFEILTAHAPASGETVGEVFRKIQAGNLPRASEVEPTVPRPLEAVCAKALAFDRAHRYRRAEDLAEDVRRWLVDEPLSVYLDPLPVRLIRWARRHRTLVTSLAALLITAVIGLAVGVILIDRERQQTEKERKTAEEQRTIAIANANQALDNLRLAQNATDGLLAEVADVDLADIPQMEPVRKRLLEKAMGGYRKFLAQQGNDPLVHWGTGRSLVRLGDIQALLGEVKTAEISYNRAVTELEALIKDNPPNTEFRRDLARAYQGLGVLLKDANRYQQSEQVLRRAIGLRDEIVCGPDPQADDSQALADSRYQLGALLARRGGIQVEDAEAYRAALEVQESLVQQYGKRPDFGPRLARYRNNLAMLQKATSQVQLAEITFRTTIELLAPSIQGPTALPGPRWYYARAANNLGTILLEEHRDGPSQWLHTARDILQTLAAEFPAVPEYSQELASVDYNLGFLARFGGHFDEALTSYKETARILQSLRGRFPDNPAIRQKLALAHVAVNDALAVAAPAEAEVSLRNALREQSEVMAQFPDVPEYKSNLGRCHAQLAGLLMKRNQLKDAAKEAEQALALHKAVLQANPGTLSIERYVRDDLGVLTHVLIASRRFPESQTVAEELAAMATPDEAAVLNAVGLFVRCAAEASKTTNGAHLANWFQGHAMKILTNAARAGLIHSRSLLERPEFAPLRARDDFKKLHDALVQPPRSG